MKLDWSSIWRGAVTTATFAVPLSLAQKWLVESGRLEKGDAIVFLINFAIMFCGAAGGYAAARLAPDLPLQHGAAAAAVAALAIQLAGAIRHAIVDEPMSSPLGWIFLALLMATFGMFGGWVHAKVPLTRNGSSPT